MHLKCEYCGIEWDTTGAIHGETSCREYMRSELAKWRQGVIDANRISQDFDARARAAEQGADKLRGDIVKTMCGTPVAWSDELIVSEIRKLIDRELEAQRDLHWARSEHAEEKKRARECEEEIVRLRSENANLKMDVSKLKKDLTDAIIDADETMGALRVERRRLAKVEDEFLIPLYDAITNYRKYGLTAPMAHRLDEVLELVKKYVDRLREE